MIGVEDGIAASPEVRQAALDACVAKNVRKGWRVVSRTETQAFLERGKRANHVLHLLLTVFTLGLWLPIWLFLLMTSRVYQDTLTVDAAGVVRNGVGKASKGSRDA